MLLLLYGVTVSLDNSFVYPREGGGGDLGFDGMLVCLRNNGGGRGGGGNVVLCMRSLVRAINWKGRMEWIPVSGLPSFVQVDEDEGWLGGWPSATSMHDEKVSATPNRLGGVLW